MIRHFSKDVIRKANLSTSIPSISSIFKASLNDAITLFKYQSSTFCKSDDQKMVNLQTS